MAEKTKEVVIKIVTPRAKKPRRKRPRKKRIPTKKPDTVQAVFERLERAGVTPERIPKEEIERRLREERIGREAEVSPREIEEIAMELEEEFPVRAKIRREEERIRRQLRRIEREAEPITRIGEAGIRAVGRIGRAITRPEVRREAGRLFAGAIPREKREPRARRIMREPEERGALGDFGLDFFDVSLGMDEGLGLGDLSVDLGLGETRRRKRGRRVGRTLGDVLDINF